MFVALVEYRLYPAFDDAFRERAVQHSREALTTQPSCRVFDVCVDPEDPCEVAIYMVFDEAGDFEAYLQSAPNRMFQADTELMVRSTRVRKMSRMI